MGRGRTWNNVPGDTTLSAYWVGDTGWICEKNDEPLPESAQRELVSLDTEDQLILSIDWLSSGYYDPGCTYGPPERCYPPEGSDERVLAGRVAFECGGVKGRLSDLASGELFDAFHDIVEEQELDYDSSDADRSDELYQRWKDEPRESYFNKSLHKILFDS